MPAKVPKSTKRAIKLARAAIRGTKAVAIAKGKMKAKNVQKKKKKKQPAAGLQVMSASAVPMVRGNVVRNIGPVINRGKGFRVRHTEYLEDIVGTVGFTTIVYPLNAGLIDSFPWLGSIGGLFETWLPHKLVFEFQSYCASTTVCSLAMATQLDTNDAQFTSFEEMLGYKGSITSPAWKSFSHNCLSGGSKTLFVRTGTAAGDQRLYDYGDFTIATEKGTAGQNLGRLLVSYDIELFTPKITVAGALNFWNSWTTSFPNAIDTQIQSSAFLNFFLLNGVAPTGWISATDSVLTVLNTGLYLFQAVFEPQVSPIYEAKAVSGIRPTLTCTNAKATIIDPEAGLAIGEYKEQDASYTAKTNNFTGGLGGVTYSAYLNVLATGAAFAFTAGSIFLHTVGSDVILGTMKLSMINMAAGLPTGVLEEKVHLTAQAKKAYLQQYRSNPYLQGKQSEMIVEVKDGWVHPDFTASQMRCKQSEGKDELRSESPVIIGRMETAPVQPDVLGPLVALGPSHRRSVSKSSARDFKQESKK